MDGFTTTHGAYGIWHMAYGIHVCGIVDTSKGTAILSGTNCLI